MLADLLVHDQSDGSGWYGRCDVDLLEVQPLCHEMRKNGDAEPGPNRRDLGMDVAAADRDRAVGSVGGEPGLVELSGVKAAEAPLAPAYVAGALGSSHYPAGARRRRRVR